ncbi:MAG: TonB family protein [Blastocatellia bacterium]
MKKVLSLACALALVANSFAGAMAQDKKQEKPAQNAEQRFVFQSDGKTVTVQTGDGNNATFGVRTPGPDGGVFRMPEGFNGVWVAGSAQQGDGSVFQFFSQEMSFDNRLVKGAPFSADIVSETIQTLPDGNRIVQRSEGRIYRDSQGRTRNERSFQMGGSSEQKQTISIFDPVANVNYILDPETRTARKTPFFFAQTGTGTPIAGGLLGLQTSAATPDKSIEPKQITVSGGVLQGSAIRKVQPPYPPVAKAAKASGAVQVQILVNETGEVIEANAINGHPLLRDAALQAARQWVFKPIELSGKPVKAQGILTFNFTLSDEAPAPPVAGARNILKFSTNKEELGKLAIEGVECEGRREVTTIPAGAVGNERPIETVNETWYSPELKMMILSKRHDPRFGESTYRVTNISRSEPDAQLFQVPSDYTIKEGGVGAGGIGLRTPMGEAERVHIETKIQAEPRKPNNQ